jgi:cyclic pyranopterin phosphate synthase
MDPAPPVPDSPADPGPVSRPPFARVFRVSVTDRCNFRCRYCVPDGRFESIPHDEILRYEEIARVVRAAASAGAWKARITGGEPLVRKGVESLVEAVAGTPGVREVCLTTNGSLLARRAAGLKAAGLSRVTVSLDTLRPDRFRRLAATDALPDVRAGIRAALDAGLLPLKVNAVVLKGVNDDEVADFLRFSAETGAEVRFIEYMPLGGGEPWGERFLPAAEIERRAVEAAGAPGSALPAEGPARRRRLFPGGARIGFIAPVSEPFCASCDRLRLTAKGTIRGCLIRGGEVDVKALLRSGAGDEALLAALRRAWTMKPASHGLGKEGAVRPFECGGMRGIGG